MIDCVSRRSDDGEAGLSGGGGAVEDIEVREFLGPDPELLALKREGKGGFQDAVLSLRVEDMVLTRNML